MCRFVAPKRVHINIYKAMKKTLITCFLSGLLCCSTACSAQKSTPANDVFTTKTGKTITLHAIKHGSIRIQIDDKEIEVDPVSNFAPKTDYAQLPKADLILVTHEHADHFDPQAIAALTKPQTTLIANARCAQMLGKGQAMNNGDKRQVEALQLSVEAVPAYNTTPDRQQFHPKGRDNGYVLDIDGFRIYIAGDTEDIAEMKKLKNIDVAFLPCNLPYTMTPRQLAKAAKMFNPKVLFPYHYGQTPIEQVQQLLKNSGIDVRIRPYQ